MCVSKPKPPPVVVRDPVADAAKAANEAQAKANAETAARRRKQRGSSLFTVGGAGLPASPVQSAYAAATARTLGGTP